MKRVRFIIIIMLVLLVSVTGCSKEKNNTNKEEQPTIRIASLKGPTSMGLVKLRKEFEDGNTKNLYDFNMYTSADEIVPLIVKGEVDIAAIPANLAAVLFQKTKGEISVLNLNTLGVLYIMENGNSISSFSDLKGKTVYMTGKGTTPEYVFRYLMSAYDLTEEDITIEFKSDVTEVASLLGAEENTVGVLPQPFATVAQMQTENVHVVLDLSKEWDQVNKENTGSLVTGVTIVRNAFLEENKELVSLFLEEEEASVLYVNNNIEEAAKLMEVYDIVKEPVAKKALPFCNISYITGEEMKHKLNGYLGVLFEANKESVGGVLPDDTFYYQP